jgi:hypothetical protein
VRADHGKAKPGHTPMWSGEARRGYTGAGFGNPNGRGEGADRPESQAKGGGRERRMRSRDAGTSWSEARCIDLGGRVGNADPMKPKPGQSRGGTARQGPAGARIEWFTTAARFGSLIIHRAGRKSEGGWLRCEAGSACESHWLGWKAGSREGLDKEKEGILPGKLLRGRSLGRSPRRWGSEGRSRGGLGQAKEETE